MRFVIGLSFMLLICAIGGSWWLINQIKATDTSSAPTLTREHPEAIVLNPHYRQLNTAGQLQTEMHSEKAVHYQQNNQTHFTKIVLTLYQVGKKTWLIHANQATSERGLEKINFYDHVKIEQLSAKTGHDLVLTTSQLTTYPQKNTAMTEQPVRIIEGHSLATGVGFSADLNNNNFRLLHQVYNRISDANKITEIHANSAYFNKKTQQRIYQGQVSIQSPDMRLTGDKVIFNNDTHGALKAMIDHGQPATLQQLGQPSAIHAQATTIKYYPKTGNLILLGNGHLKQGDDTLTGEHIVYSTKTKQIHSHTNGHQRPVIHLNPTTKPSSK